MTYKQSKHIMEHKLVNFVSGNVHLAKSKLVVIFVIQNVHQVGVEWMNILSINSRNIIVNVLNRKPVKKLIHTLLQKNHIQILLKTFCVVCTHILD